MNTKRVLVVDDELHMIRVIKLFLERAGYKVDTASNGQQALDSILLDPPDVESCPLENCLALALEIRRRDARLDWDGLSPELRVDSGPALGCGRRVGYRIHR